MQELAIALLMWMNVNTAMAYDIDAGLPNIEHVSQEELVDRLLSAAKLSDVSRSELRSMRENIAAAYLDRSRTILLGRDLDPNTVQGRAALLHELVHFVQFETGIRAEAPCLAALEYDAYTIQADYLRMHGDAPEFDEFTVRVRSTCQGF